MEFNPEQASAESKKKIIIVVAAVVALAVVALGGLGSYMYKKNTVDFITAEWVGTVEHDSVINLDSGLYRDDVVVTAHYLDGHEELVSNWAYDYNSDENNVVTRGDDRYLKVQFGKNATAEITFGNKKTTLNIPCASEAKEISASWTGSEYVNTRVQPGEDVSVSVQLDNLDYIFLEEGQYSFEPFTMERPGWYEATITTDYGDTTLKIKCKKKTPAAPKKQSASYIAVKQRITELLSRKPWSREKLKHQLDIEGYNALDVLDALFDSNIDWLQQAYEMGLIYLQIDNTLSAYEVEGYLKNDGFSDDEARKGAAAAKVKSKQ